MRMSGRRLAFVYSPELEGLSYPPECPFKTQRLGLTRRKLLALGLLRRDGAVEVPARPATRRELERLHSPRYLDELERAAAGDLTATGFAMGLGGPDTPVFRDLYAYGAWACGSALTAAELLLADVVDVAFSLAGGFHHAHAELASGFCYLNDVALACERLADAGRRVAYVDVDAHHGDGVQDFFYRRRDVLTISLHESGRTLFPGGGFEDEIGEGPGRGYAVNVPLPAGTYDEAYLTAFDAVVWPLLLAYGPEVLVVELGLDTLAGDPLTHMELTNNAVVAVLERLLALHRPMLVAGGGGYHVDHTVRGWALAWRTCLESAGEEEEFLSNVGGVFLGSSEWAGGLRDAARPVSAEQRAAVEPEVRATIRRVQELVFPQFGLAPKSVPGGGRGLTGSANLEETNPQTRRVRNTL
jgi:acetoin utilization protein AcuC